MSLVTRAISRVCVYSGLAGLCERQRRSRQEPNATILAYHRIGRPAAGQDGLDSRVLSASPAGFEWQMNYIRRHFDVLSLDNLVDRIHAAQPIPSHAALVTFDDGYRDNYDLAYPILRHYGLPAAIFLTTSFVNGTQRLWWDELAAAIGTSQVRRAHVQGLGEIRLGTPHDRRRAMEQLRRHLKALPDDERRRQMSSLLSTLGAGLRPRVPERPHLTWNEVRQMSQNGITFGAHTHSHPILTRLPPEQAEREIADSKKIVEDELGQPARFFAYPNGQRGDFDARTRAMLIGHGFEAALTMIPGSNSPASNKPDLFALRRIYVGGDDHTVFVAKASGALEMLAARFPSRMSHLG